jgi:C4-dicarboxylate transporter DctQ subunit
MAMLASAMDVIRRLERALLAAVMLGMALLYVLNVLVRELWPGLASQLAWIEEATLFALAWLVFLGLGLTLERRRHIAMTSLVERMPAWRRRLVETAINVGGLAFAVLLAKLSFDLALFILASGQVSPTLGISTVVLYAPMPIGFALLAVRYALELIGAQNRFTFAEQPGH